MKESWTVDEMEHWASVSPNQWARTLWSPSVAPCDLGGLLIRARCSMFTKVMNYRIKFTKMQHVTSLSRFILPWNFRARLYYAAASQPRVFVINASKRCTVEHEINLRVAVSYCFSSYASLVFSTCLQSKLDEKVFVNFFDWRYRTVIKWRVSKCD